MVKNEKGLSLIETVIALAVSSIGVYLLANAMSDIFKDFKQISNNKDIKTEASQTMGFIQRTMIRSDVIFYGFTATTTGNPLARFLIPRVDICADGVSTCTGQTSFVWAQYDNRKPTIPAICAVDASTLVIDLSITDFGSPSLSGNTIDMGSGGKNYPIGPISFEPNKVIALIDEPVAALFKITTGPQIFNPGYDSGSGTYSNAAFGANRDCTKNVKDPSRLIILKVTPFTIPNTGTGTPTATSIAAAMGIFPVRLAPIRILSAGMKDSLQPTDFQVKDCDSTLTCNNELIKSSSVLSVNIQETLSKPFDGQTTILPFSFNSSTYCASATCKVMSVTTPTPTQLTGESTVLLKGSSFSYLKQEYIHTISFFFEIEKQRSNTQKEKTLEVYHASSF